MRVCHLNLCFSLSSSGKCSTGASQTFTFPVCPCPQQQPMVITPTLLRNWISSAMQASTGTSSLGCSLLIIFTILVVPWKHTINHHPHIFHTIGYRTYHQEPYTSCRLFLAQSVRPGQSHRRSMGQWSSGNCYEVEGSSRQPLSLQV